MRVAAVGDAHLGRSYYPVTTPEGVNQRERDFELAFDAAIDAALAEEPDLVVWLGDVFDHPRPTYRSFRVAQRGLARIREHGIAAVVITGNHDTPRLPGTGSPYSALADAFNGMHFAHRLAYERFELPGLVVHAVPQMLTVEATLEALDRAHAERSLDRTNLLLTHPRVPQVEPRYADINEIEVDAGRIRADLVLLGHFHIHTTVRPGMWYAGSTETFSFADDPQRPKGIVLLDTDSGECRHVPIESQRPLVTLETVEALGLGPREVEEAVLTRASTVPDGAVARLFIDGVDPEAYRLLDTDAVREAHRGALWCKLEPRFAGVSAEVEAVDLESMPARWARYVAGQDLTGFDRERIDRSGAEYLSRAVEEAGGMKITRLYLRNYRTFEDPVELELPGGLVGVYGPNGAGKSALVESIPFCLYGRSRTTKDEIRTSGVGSECVVEVELEHEDHLYLVRRTICGANHTVKAEAYCDRLQVAEGARDTTRYVHSVLGMDDVAFRASVFAEQKQLAAFSEQSPAERRRLVLQLLGITPVEGARDRARRDARVADDQLRRLRQMVPDLDRLRVGLVEAESAADAADRDGRDAEAAAEEAATDLDAARLECERREAVRQQHDLVVERGRAVRDERDAAERRAAELAAELVELEGAAAKLAELQLVAEGLGESEEVLSLVDSVVRAAEALATVPLPARPDVPDEQAAEDARTQADRSRSEAAELDGRIAGARAERERAQQAVARSSQLSGEAHCPTCGQPLGGAFEQVQSHRAAELADAETALVHLECLQVEAGSRAREADRCANELRQELRAARERWDRWQRVLERRESAASDLEAAIASLEKVVAGSGGAWRPPVTTVLAAVSHPLDATCSEPVVDGRLLSGLVRDLRSAVKAGRAAVAECARLNGRLERRQVATTELAGVRALVAETDQRLAGLRKQVADLGHSADELASAHRAREEASARASAAAADARRAGLAAERARAHAESEGKRLAEAEDQHALVDDLGEEVRHLGRLAELLSSFRNSVVATAGPRLSAQAAELFAELTDHEYDLLKVDPETYEIQICDQGVVHGMDRFSGSETDLANLSLRVAISEQVRFQSGGAVGLLVLDEVFGPLDEDRKERMLLALERLRGRFRQVVVVTHASDIKEQLPSAVEVVKLPGRRATAHLI